MEYNSNKNINKTIPKVGIVILNYNSHNLTVSLAKKINDFSSVNYICVVDNCSNDDFENDFIGYKKIHYIKTKKNLGYSAGNNVGLRYLVNEKFCKFVCIANPDVLFDDKTLIELANKLLEFPKLVLASTKRFGYKGEEIHQYFNFPNLNESIRKCFFIFRRGVEKRENKIQNCRVDEANQILFVDAVPGAFFCMKSSFLLENDFLYEDIFLYGEEIILGRQAKNLGYKVGIINTGSYYHNHIRTKFSNRKMFWYDRCSLLKYFKLFNLLKWYQLLILNLSIILGTIEYNCLYIIYKIIKR